MFIGVANFRPSERNAEELSQLLVAATRPETEFIVAHGANRCQAKKGESACDIVCAESHNEHGQPAYDIVCRREVDGAARQMTAGRSSSASEIVATVFCWMEGQTVEDLHVRFPYLGGVRRLYASIEEGILRYSPELADKTTRSTKDLYAFSEGCELLFRTPTRSCCISLADSFHPSKGQHCWFTWNEGSALFDFPLRDLNQTAQILKRWLCDDAMPSQLRMEFPWLTIGTLADYYEAGRIIEGEFLAGWDDVEEHFRGMRNSFHDPLFDSYQAEVLAFIADIRRAGFDRTLRGGTAVYYLIASRSRHYGLRDDQPRIMFEFHAGTRVFPYAEFSGLVVRENVTGPGRVVSFPEIKFTPAIAELLRQLEAHEID